MSRFETTQADVRELTAEELTLFSGGAGPINGDKPATRLPLRPEPLRAEPTHN